jgi:DNA-binding response OmpR family regulator
MANSDSQVPGHFTVIGDVRFDTNTGWLLSPTDSARLTSKEQEVLLILHKEFGKVVYKEALFERLYYGEDKKPDPKIIDIFMFKIRKKLAKVSQMVVIETHWGRGHELVVKQSPGPSVH